VALTNERILGQCGLMPGLVADADRRPKEALAPGDGAIVEFHGVVDPVRCAVEVQNAIVERNAGVPEGRRIEFRIGIHLGDVVEETDGDLMGERSKSALIAIVAEPGLLASGDALQPFATAITRRLGINRTSV
jgi:hypothetical protein